MRADRIVGSDIATQLVMSGLATATEFEHVATAWREWAANPDGWMSVLHGQILIRA